MAKLIDTSKKIWGSAFILPEHKEMLYQYEREKMKKKKPEFDEQRLIELSNLIAEAKVSGEIVKVVIFGEFDDEVKKGRITKVDTVYRKLKLEYDDDFEWIKLDDVIDIIL